MDATLRHESVAKHVVCVRLLQTFRHAVLCADYMAVRRKVRRAATLTELGRAELRGDVDWMPLQPTPRWVGGVHVGVRTPGWRWDEATRGVVQI